MIITNFVLTGEIYVTRTTDREYFAEVDVTTGANTVRRKISRKYAEDWRFVDNGKLMPRAGGNV